MERPRRIQKRKAPDLPESVIMLILSLLPLKTLMQFKCVCRSWNSLISSPFFVTLKYLTTPKHANIILTVKGEDHDTLDRAIPYSVPFLLNFPPSPVSEYSSVDIMDYHEVVGTCRGLVCIAGPLVITEDEIWVNFWNPATRIVSERSPRLHRGANMTMDFGFGYDYKTEAYKVVALIANWHAEDDPKNARIKVFTMGDSCWRDMGIFPALPIAGTPTHKNDGIYIMGTLNWLALRNFGDDNAWDVVAFVDQLVIGSLDLGKETYKQIGVPDGLDELSEHMPVLGVLRNCLYLCHDYKTSHFVFWQMNLEMLHPGLNCSMLHISIFN
ncbi:hypothetical protein PIB30_046560 [Stylosanthes scabra]|uniref:F-box domain-containing protein n=1 Tax=Stylosanthes scabra TaxID=79078 RepID=A0ABU6VEV6_9FABA|nr:hypothetical protein [Stylosanthes scabra]